MAATNIFWSNCQWGNKHARNLRFPGLEDTSNFAPLNVPSQLPPQTECGICKELYDTGETLSLADCKHEFCKECLTRFIKMKISTGRYPIFCPGCSAPSQRLRTSKSLTQDIIDQLNFTKEELRRLEELQLVTHSITSECPGCKESMRVDRAQFVEQSIIVCKNSSSKKDHRCKNGNIDRLMRKNGWQYCPGCKTPVEKEEGCDYLVCVAPGCNAHFCYMCGVLLMDTAGQDFLMSQSARGHYCDFPYRPKSSNECMVQ